MQSVFPSGIDLLTSLIYKALFRFDMIVSSASAPDTYPTKRVFIDYFSGPQGLLAMMQEECCRVQREGKHTLCRKCPRLSLNVAEQIRDSA